MPASTGDPAALLGNGAQVFISGYAWRSSSDWSMGQSFNGVNVSGVKTGYGARDSLQAAWRIGVGGDFNGQSFPAALTSGVTAIPTFIRGTVVGIYDLITVPSLGGVTGPNGFSGPVGIAEQTASAANNGFLGQGGLVYWIGFISLNLGFINILPIPFLDGGKLLFLGIEAVRRKRLEPRHEAIASAVGLALVLVFVVYVTIGDVGRI
jgi:regulator of sigma E protease